MKKIKISKNREKHIKMFFRFLKENKYFFFKIIQAISYKNAALLPKIPIIKRYFKNYLNVIGFIVNFWAFF